MCQEYLLFPNVLICQLSFECLCASDEARCQREPQEEESKVKIIQQFSYPVPLLWVFMYIQRSRELQVKQ